MKYYLLQRGESPNQNALFSFTTRPQRDEATIKAIFGKDLQNQNEAEEWDKIRADLNDKGRVSFEGEPSIEWFTATPNPKAKRPPVSDEKIREIHRRASAGLAWGEQKVIAIDLGLSKSYVNQVIRGHRRKERAA